MEKYLFYIFGSLAVLTALLVITRKNPVSSALFLVVCLFCLAALYVLLGAHFVAAAQVLVYAGAIMVLFLFVIMLLDLRHNDIDVPGRNVALKAAGVFLAGGVLFLVGREAAMFELSSAGEIPEGFGTVEAVARLLFTDYLLPFELASVLLLAAIVVAVVIAKREL